MSNRKIDRIRRDKKLQDAAFNPPKPKVQHDTIKVLDKAGNEVKTIKIDKNGSEKV